jgi:hypothetical protein
MIRSRSGARIAPNNWGTKPTVLGTGIRSTTAIAMVPSRSTATLKIRSCAAYSGRPEKHETPSNSKRMLEEPPLRRAPPVSLKWSNEYARVIVES